MTSDSKTIFLAEDDDDDTMFFLEALREINCTLEIITSRDGVELMEKLDAYVPPIPKVLFLDLNIPKKNGVHCLIEIKRTDKLRNIPIVILSTSHNLEHIRTTYYLGANYYMIKPYTFSQLANGIKKILQLNLSNHGHISIDEFVFRP